MTSALLALTLVALAWGLAHAQLGVADPIGQAPAPLLVHLIHGLGNAPLGVAAQDHEAQVHGPRAVLARGTGDVQVPVEPETPTALLELEVAQVVGTLGLLGLRLARRGVVAHAITLGRRVVGLELRLAIPVDTDAIAPRHHHTQHQQREHNARGHDDLLLWLPNLHSGQAGSGFTDDLAW